MDDAGIALMRFLHILGAVLGVGGLAYLGLAVLPATRRLETEREAFLTSLRHRAGVLTATAVLLLLVTGVFRWVPELGGVGWFGAGGIWGIVLVGKIVLALFVFHLATSLARSPKDAAAAAARPSRVRLAALLGVVVVLLGVLHHTAGEAMARRNGNAPAAGERSGSGAAAGSPPAAAEPRGN